MLRRYHGCGFRPALRAFAQPTSPSPVQHLPHCVQKNRLSSSSFFRCSLLTPASMPSEAAETRCRISLFVLLLKCLLGDDTELKLVGLGILAQRLHAKR